MRALLVVLVCAASVRSGFAEEDPLPMCGLDEKGQPLGGCQCNDTLVDCDSVYFGIEPDDPDQVPLSSPDVLVNKSVTVKVASFRDNAIEILRKGKILPGHEETLEELYFTYNKISRIENETFSSMKQLKVLDLSFNKLQRVQASWFPKAEANFTLEYLNLENNSLVSLPNEVFSRMPMLQTLILDGNSKLSFKDFEFSEKLGGLKKLSMSTCNITYLNDTIFMHLRSLEVLYLLDNPLVAVPAGLANMPSLQFLDLSQTNITEIEENAFVNDSKLEELYFENCEYLTAVSKCSFCGLNKLQRLVFRHAVQLRDFDDEAFGSGKELPVLITFDLEYCNISKLSPRMLDYSKIQYLRIGGNPWSCTCDMDWLLDLNVDETLTMPKCLTPKSLKGRQLDFLTAQDLCPGRLRITKLVLSLFVLLTASTITILIYYLSTNYKLRNIFYRPDLPHIGYSNLNRAEDEEARHAPLPSPEVI